MIARGINGIAINLFSTCDWSQSGANCGGNPGSGGKAGYPGALINVLRAAAAVDKRFKVLPMPDMTAGIKPTDLPNMWTAPIDGTTIYNHPNIYRWADSNNYPQLSPFCTECFPASQYATALSVMKSNGTPVSWGPVFGSGGCNGQANGCTFSSYASLPTATLNGMHDVSTDRTSAARVLANVGGVSKGAPYGGGTKINWTGPVKLFGGMGPQAYQSASGTVYEAHNSEAYRAAWESQIALGSALGDVMIFTWNDYGEGTAIAPSQNQYNHPSMGFYDLTGYYTTWLRKGSPPEITDDAIVYFYRRQSYSAAHNATISGLSKRPTIPSWNLPAYDEIELVAFVKDDAEICIWDGKKLTTIKVKKGMNVLRAPLVAGSPQFFVYRNSVKLIDVKGWPTYGSGQIPAGSVSGLTMCSNCFPAGIPDPIYYSGSTFNWSNGVALNGSDMSSVALNPATPAACETKCWNDSSCKSWQFSSSVCKLKNGSPRESLAKGVASGHKLRF
ncbi:endo-1,3-alpha-glucanase family glycosylhydrolase [Methylocella sp.]|uniref:endo-1,3-alpha-glucanase family glycosylhydrolase n=1 Tax=Methylocella sp. TaxID=1978226 RepID=UPI0037846470